MKTLLMFGMAVLAAIRILAGVAAVSEVDGCKVLANGLARVEFDVTNGTFTIRDAQGGVRLADAGVGATGVKRGAAFKAKTDEVH
ncbi:MAG: hypothetical protein J5985_01010, partial [Kiritimatiellae bacterium]|nr:hypothetical protein [Kiritimatiellia bacterium]